MSEALSPWRKPTTQHNPGKIILDLALSLAVGGDCLADIAALREQPAVFGQVASDATVSRLITALAADGPAALSAINSARAAARKTAWSHAGIHAPDHHIDAQRPLIIDLDATLVTAHSEKKKTAPNFKRGYGFHPLLAFFDHGPDGTGEPLRFLLRPGNAGSNTDLNHLNLVGTSGKNTNPESGIRQHPDCTRVGLSHPDTDSGPENIIGEPIRPAAVPHARLRLVRPIASWWT